jgi:putative hydrolase of HD superfamily
MNPELHKPTDQLITDLIFPFYQLDRDMELPITNKLENDAEHSWSLAFAACALAPTIDPALDTGKIAQFAIVHDLVEVYSGDISIYDTDPELHANKEENELQAMEQLRKDHAHLPWIAETIDAYERKDTAEANYVWAMDKYVAMCMRRMHAKPFFHKKGITKEFFDHSMVRVRQKVSAYPPISKLFDDLLLEFDAHPEWFAQNNN